MTKQDDRLVTQSIAIAGELFISAPYPHECCNQGSDPAWVIPTPHWTLKSFHQPCLFLWWDIGQLGGNCHPRTTRTPPSSTQPPLNSLAPFSSHHLEAIHSNWSRSLWLSDGNICKCSKRYFLSFGRNQKNGYTSVSRWEGLKRSVF